jgi:integrase
MPKASRRKPGKPYPSFPLTAHPNGQWCKKIRGKVHFFGTWVDPDAALAKYLGVAADLHAGRDPASVSSGELTVKEMGNEFLASQMERVSSGQIGGRWFEDCRRVVRHFAKHMGVSRPAAALSASDFQRYRRLLVTQGLSGQKGLGVFALTRAIAAVRAMFKWAFDTGLLKQTPRWGKGFARPSVVEFRRSRAMYDRENGKRLFTSEQVRSLIKAAGPALRAATLLGINGGFGNSDCSALPIAAVDLKAAIIDFERPKTAVRRVVPLWPETITALKTLLTAERVAPATEAAAPLVFRTESGLPVVRQIMRAGGDGEFEKVTHIDRLSDWFDELLAAKKLKRRGIGFYTLRHTFRTWADETNDQHAIHLIMGHAIPGMSGIYVEEIGVERLRKVVNHVRSKLWPQSPAEQAPPAGADQSSTDEVGSGA